MAQFSKTWWGKRFIEALEEFTESGRLGRGRSYARNDKIKSSVDHKVSLRGTSFLYEIANLNSKSQKI